MQYVSQPMFWVAVIIVALVVNFVWHMVTGKGKIV